MTVSAAALRIEVLSALHRHGEQDLSAIHAVLNRPRMDVSLLPIVGGLVQDGLVEKVLTPCRELPGSARYGTAPIPVRFRITDAGRKMLAP